MTAKKHWAGCKDKNLLPNKKKNQENLPNCVHSADSVLTSLKLNPCEDRFLKVFRQSFYLNTEVKHFRCQHSNPDFLEECSDKRLYLSVTLIFVFLHVHMQNDYQVKTLDIPDSQWNLQPMSKRLDLEIPQASSGAQDTSGCICTCAKGKRKWQSYYLVNQLFKGLSSKQAECSSAPSLTA